MRDNLITMATVSLVTVGALLAVGIHLGVIR